MNAALPVAGSGLALIVAAHGAWWSLLSLAALRRPRPSPPPAQTWRFAVIVPAHNEEAGITDCLASLKDAPFAPRPEIIVVADNCTDATADVARAHGVTVLERTSQTERGKSFALDFALRTLAARPTPPDAVLFVDADTRVSGTFYSAIASAFERGAQAVQVHYAAEPDDAPLARLRALALLLVHWARPLGAARLGLGTGLKGNGMAMRWHLVNRGVGGAGLAEDAAMTLALAARGVPVRFVPGATVWGRMASSYADAETQDRRWEGGRLSLIPRALVTALVALGRGRIACAAAALEVAALPLSALAAAAIVSGGLALAGFGSAWLAVVAAGSLVAYVTIGLLAARPSPRDLLALRSAPRFFLYKLRVFAGLLTRRQSAWERTAR
ncbi:MAG: glycosyltransferase family 2 protein [Hyphomicrobiales bacterium]